LSGNTSISAQEEASDPTDEFSDQEDEEPNLPEPSEDLSLEIIRPAPKPKNRPTLEAPGVQKSRAGKSISANPVLTKPGIKYVTSQAETVLKLSEPEICPPEPSSKSVDFTKGVEGVPSESHHYETAPGLPSLTGLEIPKDSTIFVPNQESTFDFHLRPPTMFGDESEADDEGPQTIPSITQTRTLTDSSISICKPPPPEIEIQGLDSVSSTLERMERILSELSTRASSRLIKPQPPEPDLFQTPPEVPIQFSRPKVKAGRIGVHQETRRRMTPDLSSSHLPPLPSDDSYELLLPMKRLKVGVPSSQFQSGRVPSPNQNLRDAGDGILQLGRMREQHFRFQPFPTVQVHVRSRSPLLWAQTQGLASPSPLLTRTRPFVPIPNTSSESSIGTNNSMGTAEFSSASSLQGQYNMAEGDRRYERSWVVRNILDLIPVPRTPHHPNRTTTPHIELGPLAQLLQHRQLEDIERRAGGIAEGSRITRNRW
jgi:hypothetical protein